MIWQFCWLPSSDERHDLTLGKPLNKGDFPFTPMKQCHQNQCCESVFYWQSGSWSLTGRSKRKNNGPKMINGGRNGWIIASRSLNNKVGDFGMRSTGQKFMRIYVYLCTLLTFPKKLRELLLVPSWAHQFFQNWSRDMVVVFFLLFGGFEVFQSFTLPDKKSTQRDGFSKSLSMWAMKKVV